MILVSPAAHFLLCSQVPNRPWAGTGPWPWGVGTPGLEHILTNSCISRMSEMVSPSGSRRGVPDDDSFHTIIHTGHAHKDTELSPAARQANSNPG